MISQNLPCDVLEIACGRFFPAIVVLPVNCLFSAELHFSRLGATPAPITPATTFPGPHAAQSQTPPQARLRYRDPAASVSVKAKPFGVTRCQVFGMASDTPATDQDGLPMIATPTK